MLLNGKRTEILQHMKVLRLEQIQEEKIPTVFLLLPCNEDDSELSAADGKFYAQNS